MGSCCSVYLNLPSKQELLKYESINSHHFPLPSGAVLGARLETSGTVAHDFPLYFFIFILSCTFLLLPHLVFQIVINICSRVPRPPTAFYPFVAGQSCGVTFQFCTHHHHHPQGFVSFESEALPIKQQLLQTFLPTTS